ncbi:MAG: hypothetical protein A3F16_03015 [Deltaproteobacteria bacterium RIFCSPHIGHO2_12_FULL_43_9]|nr:MAG: hypothetical protein A3F16_03015 [Deltaproteobacteria bacterium RIFCSPHIGHO2_12_FULL_43_9]
MRVAIIVSARGYHWVELASPIRWLERKEIAYSLFTPDGREPVADPLSLETRPILSKFGFGSPRRFAPEGYWGTQLLMDLNEAQDLSFLNVEDFDCLYIPGGHGTLFDINRNKLVLEKVRLFLKAGKGVGAVCHATSTIALSDQKAFKGVPMTGFPEFLDKVLNLFSGIHPTFLPMPFSNEKTLEQVGVSNGFFRKCMAVVNPYYMVRSDNIVTGVGPLAARGVVKSLIYS